VIAEFNIGQIIMANLKGNIKIVTLEELLPFSFSASDFADA
jgi:cytidine deaminase